MPCFASNDEAEMRGNTTVIITLDGQEISGHMEVRTERSLYQGRLR